MNRGARRAFSSTCRRAPAAPPRPAGGARPPRAAGGPAPAAGGRGGESAARIAAIERLRVAVDILEHRQIERESPLRAVLVQGVSAGDRMDFTVPQAGEVGGAAARPPLPAGA